ncbi:MAG: bifunctional demethylmenaquinone methyltransferase/2-methoxy-6-polyprenyl-1,4-benzoquinol methylase UbiE [Syntrophales bacterium]|nr:bifunctional demethylmenaquinone methyltransferase/2-methoxy-6-polyprenyl-1,4-benzoquinol methylase UbiE [Syntrophales bacterium]
MKQLTSEEHRRLVKDIFSSIYSRYDMMNHILSVGCDFYWRKAVIRRLSILSPLLILDVACGTGDLTIGLAQSYPKASVVGVDFSNHMLAQARHKILYRNLASRIKLIRGDALRLPFPENTFQAAAVAFGIRNMNPFDEALKELARVLAPGGHVAILEMHNPPQRWRQVLFRFYCRTIIRWGARMFSKNASAYDYLVESIRQFPSPEDFKHSMEERGFKKIESHALFPGITYLHVGRKHFG